MQKQATGVEYRGIEPPTAIFLRGQLAQPGLERKECIAQRHVLALIRSLPQAPDPRERRRIEMRVFVQVQMVVEADEVVQADAAVRSRDNDDKHQQTADKRPVAATFFGRVRNP